MSSVAPVARLVALAAGLLAGTASQAAPQLFTVGAVDDQFGCTHTSIAAALQAAQLNGPELDYIVVTNSAGYAGQALRITSQSVEIRGGFSNCGLSADEGQPFALIGGNGIDPLLRIEPAATGEYEVRLENLRLSGGGNPGVDGGAIHLRPGTLTFVKLVLSHTELSGNRANRGGGIYAVRGPAPDGDYTVLLKPGTRITGNTAAGGGGGLNINDGALHVEAHDVRIAGNTAGGAGGGIFVSNGRLIVGNPEQAGPRNDVSGAQVEGNSAGTIGGGIYLFGASTLMNAQELIVEWNDAATSGGGIAASNGAKLRLVRDSSDGLGWLCPRERECTRLSQNRAGGGTATGSRGGALALYSSQAELAQAVVRHNEAQDASGIYVEGASVLRAEGVVFTGQRSTDQPSQGSAVIRAYYVAPAQPPELLIAYSTFMGNVRRGTDGNLQRGLDVAGWNNTVFSTYSSAYLDSPYPWVMYGPHVSDCIVQRSGGVLDGHGTHTRNTAVAQTNTGVFLNGALNDWRPRFSSPLVDFCNSAAYIPRYRDRDLQPRCRNDAKADIHGQCDAGAWENDQLFADGYGG
jgi:hypothetical protein